MSFSQAVSGLGAASSNLDVIGNNIANSATVGFKSSTASFADIFAGSNVGLGVKVAGVIQNFNDGTPTVTSRGLDVAISQQGFFRMQDTNGSVYYSRNGQFTLDADRNLVNLQGMQLTGYGVAGTPPEVQTGTNPVPLSVPSTQMQARGTENGSLIANLDSNATWPGAGVPFDPANPDSYNAKSSMTAYDSLGNPHKIDMYFTKSDTNNIWTFRSIDTTTGTQSPPTELFFNDNGQMVGGQNQLLTMGAYKGANPATFPINLTGSTQQFQNGTSTFGNPKQDGYSAGDLVGYQINDDGTLVGNYSNQKTQVFGQIVLTNFANVEGLEPRGNNVWAETSSSGQPLLGLAGTGNLGTLTAGALESSNVDMSKELVNMIVAQRNYQANAQTIKTQDQILNTLVNLR